MTHSNKITYNVASEIMKENARVIIELPDTIHSHIKKIISHGGRIAGGAF